MAGKYLDVAGSDDETDCIACVVGKYSTGTGRSAAGGADCIDCPAGTYIDITASDELSDCIDCGADTYLEVTGSDDVSDCIACPDYSGTLAAAGSDAPADCTCDAGYTGTIVPPPSNISVEFQHHVEVGSFLY